LVIYQTIDFVGAEPAFFWGIRYGVNRNSKSDRSDRVSGMAMGGDGSANAA